MAVGIEVLAQSSAVSTKIPKHPASVYVFVKPGLARDMMSTERGTSRFGSLGGVDFLVDRLEL